MLRLGYNESKCAGALKIRLGIQWALEAIRLIGIVGFSFGSFVLKTRKITGETLERQ